MRLADILPISFEWSQKLGVRELPRINAEHQSNVPGIYVVGDLADAPIIKVALQQGYDVAQRVALKLSRAADDAGLLDVVVVGAGPAGIGAALALEEAGARYVVIEREMPFASIQNFPKAKLIFSEPREMQSPGNFWFEDARKEELVERWSRALDDRELPIHQPEEVLSIERDGRGFVVQTRVGEAGLAAGSEQMPEGQSSAAGASNSYRCRRVILAIGRRGAVQRLHVPGAELDKVAYTLKDAADYRGRRVLVAGGGDSAVEAALACAEAGAEVTISYRQPAFSRAKLLNQQRITDAIDRGVLRAELATTPVEVRDDAVVLARGGERLEVANDDVLVFFGTKLPSGFLRRLGIRMAGEMDLLRAAWITAFAFVTYAFYVLKHKKSFFPFGDSDMLGWLPLALEVDLGFRTVDAGFWGTVLYATVILVFGVRVYRKYPSRQQKTRYLSLIGFQWIFLFGVPELLAPLIIDRPWKLYAISVPWPLSIWSLVDAPSWANGDALAAMLWIGVGLLTTLVAIPLYVRSQGQRFCSYLCGCGGMAETLGDFWRHLAPRGLTSYKAEWAGRVVLFLAVPVTLLILNDAWQFFAAGALYDSKVFAQHWYGLMVDFWLASVVGVALYPYLGNRIWCRYFCPLRAYLELLAKRFARISIRANDKCIGCSECTRYCQMGIDVQRFAQLRADMHNGNSSCIQCGICVQVCPMEVLSVGGRDPQQDRHEAAALAPATGPLVRLRARRAAD